MGFSGSKLVSSHETGGKRKAVRVWLLGDFRISAGSRTIHQDAWRLRKAAALVKLLALAPDHRMHREQVMDLLWPDSAKRAASNNLRQVVYGARKVLDPSSGSREGYLSLRDEQLILCPDGQLWVDVEAFVETAAISRRSREPATYRSAIELYAGELLPEDRYEGWAEGRREELRQLYLALVIELAGLYEGREEHALAIEVLRKATSEEPTLEEAHASLMRLYALSGRPERALAQYGRLRSTLAKELGMEPSLATRRLSDEIAAGRLPTVPPADPTRGEPSVAARHNLPAPRTSFVGREQETIGVKRTLAMTKLLTLTGTGGSGKTRLAMEVARDLVGSYPDGVWLVELASLSEPGLVVQETASAMGVQERPGEPLADTLADALAGKEVLLVLDNCEHVVEGATRMVDALLASCIRLKVLATSREPLGVSGEVVWGVNPLSVPGRRRRPTPDELVRYESIRLFAERALFTEQALYGSSGFALGSDNASAVAELCRRLEGIPLAIELAAAWVGTLTTQQISERLKASLGLLKGGRTLAGRQRTLRGAMDWSHELLSEPERALFGRLSVFAGGWTLEAAEAVGVGEGVEEEGVLELLWNLVNKSLVVAEAGTRELAARYRMLEPVRQYASEKLEESGEAETVRHRHAEHFLALAERAQTAPWGPDEATWSEHLEAEHDNLRATLLRTLEQDGSETPLRLAGALAWFWRVRGHANEGAKWLEEALAKGGLATTTARAGALLGLGDILRPSDIERAQGCLEEALALYEGLGDRFCEARPGELRPSSRKRWRRPEARTTRQ
jgi:predicted ATPase/DNA-binding SARP family transcriptional activator